MDRLLLEYKPELVPKGIDHWRVMRFERSTPEAHEHCIPEATRKKLGRPFYLKTDISREAEKLAAVGITDEGMAIYFDISLRTFMRYKRRNQQLCHAIKKGKARAVIAVTTRLYNLAQDTGAKNQLGAIIFYLINRDGDNWKNPKAMMQQTNITKVGDGKKNADSRFTGEDADFQNRILGDLATILKV